VFAPASILHMMQRVFDLPVASDPAHKLAPDGLEEGDHVLNSYKPAG